MTERIPQIVKRCPKCKNITLVYNAKENKIHCSACGFEQEFLK